MKFQRILLIVLLAFCGVMVKAQDKIHKNGGEVIVAKVIEVNEDFILYKMFNNQDGPNYRIQKNAVEKVVYANGVTESFVAPAAAPAPSRGFTSMGRLQPDYGKNIIGFDFLSILFNEVGFSYERILGQGFIGVKLPLIIGVIPADNQVRNYANVFQTGIDLNLYPTGQGETKYFIGPSIRFGEVQSKYEYVEYDVSGNIVDKFRPSYNSVAFQVNNGVMFQPTPHFNVSLVFGIGLRKLTYNGDNSLNNYNGYSYPYNSITRSSTVNYATFNAFIAYRF